MTCKLWCRFGLALLGALLLPACMQEAANADEPSQANAGVMTDSINYRHDRGMKYTLFDLSQTPPKAVGGAIVRPLATGGEKGCCIKLPQQWQPGMKVRVEWGEADEQIYPENYIRELEIPRYQTPADLYVVFYPEHEVEVVVSPAEPGHPDWAGKIKQTPWEDCVAKHGRKVCKAALPKRFDTGARGFCTYLKEDNQPGNDKLCADATFMCMQDYEDEEFCKNILWESKKK